MRALDRFRVNSAEGQHFGWLVDFYFEDSSWLISHLVISLDPVRFGRKHLLLTPHQVTALNEDSCDLQTNVAVGDLNQLPLATSVLPVCKQYAALAYSSPGARKVGSAAMGSNPRLRSARALLHYTLDIAGECGGKPVDFLFDDQEWAIRYLAIEQVFDRKMRFHILPQSVDRITWAAQRVLLRELQPVQVSLGAGSGETGSEKAA